MTATTGRPRATDWVALVCLLGAVVLWGGSFLITKVAVATASPSVVTFVRCVIAAVLLGAYAGVQARRGEPSVRVATADSRWVLWTVLCGVATGVAFLTTAIGMQDVDAGVAGIPTATIPAWTMLLSGAMGIERVGRRHLVSIVVGSVALALLATSGDGRWAVGGVLALAVAALAHAGANLASHLSLRGSTPVRVAALSLVAAAVVTAPGAIHALPVAMPSGASIAAIVALGALPSAAAYVMYFHSIEVLGATRSSLSTYVIPPFALLVGVVLLGERPGMIAALALALALGALVIGVGNERSPL